MIDLSRNESPHPLSARIRKEIAAGLDHIHRYPVRIGEQARAAAANHFGVAVDRLVLTRGIDDAVDRLIWTYGDKHFFVVSPGFEGFVERLRANHIAYSSLRLDSEFRLPEAEIGRLTSDSFLLVSDPNNPTGRRFAVGALTAALARCHGALVDQTYDDFATSPVPRLPDRRDLYRFRSFSKGFGLAGLRLGALIGTAHDIEAVERRSHYCPIDTISARAVLCVTAGSGFRQNVEKIIRLRGELVRQLRRGGFDILTCDANFLLLRCDNPGDLVAHLEAQGILVKDTGTMGLGGHVRISIGSREDNTRLVEALVSFRGGRAGDGTARAAMPRHLAV